MTKTKKSDAVIFRVTPAKNELYRELAKSKGFKNISELMIDALQEYETKHGDPVREMHRIAAEMARFKLSLERKESNYESALIVAALDNAISEFKKLPTWSESYYHSFEQFNL